MEFDKQNRILSGNLIDAIKTALQQSGDPHLLAEIATHVFDLDFSYDPEVIDGCNYRYYRAGRSQRDTDLEKIKAALDNESGFGQTRRAQLYKEIISLNGRILLVKREIFKGEYLVDWAYDVVCMIDGKPRLVTYDVDSEFEQYIQAQESELESQGEEDSEGEPPDQESGERPYIEWALTLQTDGSVTGIYETNWQTETDSIGEVVRDESYRWPNLFAAISTTGVSLEGVSADVTVTVFDVQSGALLPVCDERIGKS